MTRTGRFGQTAWARALPTTGVAAIAASNVRRVRAVPGMMRSVCFERTLAPDRGCERPLRLVLAVFLAVFLAVLHATAEFQVGQETLRLDPAGIAAIAAPGGELLDRLVKTAAGGIDPGQAFVGLESRDVGKPAVLVALQPHAAAAAHFRHLVEGEDHHLAVLADRRDEPAFDRRDGARFVGRLDVEHLLALAGIAEAFVLGHDESPARFAGDHKLAAALIAEYRDHVGLLLDLAVEPDRLAVAAAARELGRFDGVAAAVGGEDQKL